MNYPLFAGRTDDSGVFAQQCTLLLNLHTFKAACPLWYPLAPELTSNLLFHLPFWPRCHPHLTTHSELQLFHHPEVRLEGREPLADKAVNADLLDSSFPSSKAQTLSQLNCRLGDTKSHPKSRHLQASPLAPRS